MPSVADLGTPTVEEAEQIRFGSDPDESTNLRTASNRSGVFGGYDQES